MLERELHHEFAPGELADDRTRLRRARARCPPAPISSTPFLDLYSAQLAGFYDPIDRRMVLVTEALAHRALHARRSKA